MTIAFEHLTTAADGDTEIAGRGLRVYTVLGLYETGDNPEYIADEYGVPLAAVFEALAYAAEHPEEMETIREADEAAEQHILSQLPEHLQQIGQASRERLDRARRKAIRQAQEARHGAPVS